MMAQRGIVLVPTLTTFHDLAERFERNFAPVLVEQAKRQLDEARLTLVAAARAGVPIAMGHDSGPPGGDAMALVHMIDAGLSPLQAIATATSGSAQPVGLGPRGSIQPG